jgi:pyrophosphatase PpaX
MTPALDVRTVLFDLDGTLVDSLDLILESFRHTMRLHFGEAPSDQMWLRTLGTPLRAQFREVADTDEEVQSLIDTYIEHNHREHERLIRPYDGVGETLLALRRRGFRLGVVTSKALRGTELSLAACRLRLDWFEVVVTSDEPVPHKPDPAPLNLALERLNEGPGAAVYVGDSVWDIRAGRAAGMRTAGALWGPFSPIELAAEKPDLLLEGIEQLLDILPAKSTNA